MDDKSGKRASRGRSQKILPTLLMHVDHEFFGSKRSLRKPTYLFGMPEPMDLTSLDRDATNIYHTVLASTEASSRQKTSYTATLLFAGDEGQIPGRQRIREGPRNAQHSAQPASGLIGKRPPTITGLYYSSDPF